MLNPGETYIVQTGAGAFLRVARQKNHCAVLGPGLRAVVWFHGCALNCPGCIAFEMNNSANYLSFTADQLSQWVSSIDGIEGITLSGGDPFDQPKTVLIDFLGLVREKTGLSVVCYTGRTLRQLLDAPDKEINSQILAAIDMLIDGPFDQTQNTGEKWRGSANQEIHFLSNRYEHLRGDLQTAKERSIEMEISLDNTLTMAGIPENGFMSRLRHKLDARGVQFRFKPD